jgi:hypothetical protein
MNRRAGYLSEQGSSLGRVPAVKENSSITSQTGLAIVKPSWHLTLHSLTDSLEKPQADRQTICPVSGVRNLFLKKDSVEFSGTWCEGPTVPCGQQQLSACLDNFWPCMKRCLKLVNVHYWCNGGFSSSVDFNKMFCEWVSNIVLRTYYNSHRFNFRSVQFTFSAVLFEANVHWVREMLRRLAKQEKRLSIAVTSTTLINQQK